MYLWLLRYIKLLFMLNSSLGLTDGNNKAEKPILFRLHYAKTKVQISFAVNAKLTSAFVFATRIVQFLFYLNPKLPVSSHFLCLNSSVCVRNVRKSHCWFSHDAAHMSNAHMSRDMRKPDLCLCENKGADHSAVTAQLISAFDFTTRIVQFLLYLYSKFQDSNLLLRLYTPVCVRPGRKP